MYRLSRRFERQKPILPKTPKIRMRTRAAPSPHRDDEQPRKTQQYLAVEARLVVLRDLLRIGGDELARHLRVQGREERAQRRALEPFDDRVRARHHVVV